MNKAKIKLQKDRCRLLFSLAAICEKNYFIKIVTLLGNLQIFSLHDSNKTIYEKEMIQERISRKVYEQDSVLCRIKESYEDLDNELETLEEDRLECNAESIHLDLLLITLHQELIILREFEALEDYLTEKVIEKTREYSASKKWVIIHQVYIE